MSSRPWGADWSLRDGGSPEAPRRRGARAEVSEGPGCRGRSRGWAATPGGIGGSAQGGRVSRSRCVLGGPRPPPREERPRLLGRAVPKGQGCGAGSQRHRTEAAEVGFNGSQGHRLGELAPVVVGTGKLESEAGE